MPDQQRSRHGRRAYAEQAPAAIIVRTGRRCTWVTVLVAVAGVGCCLALSRLPMRPGERTVIVAGYVLIAALLTVLVAQGEKRHLDIIARARAERAAFGGELAGFEQQWTALLAEAIGHSLAQVRETGKEIRRGDSVVPVGDPALIYTPAAGLQGILAGIAQIGAEGRYTALAATRHRQSDVSEAIARRLQTLVIRSLQTLDALQREIEDPAVLYTLFQLDHAITQERRHIENLALLGGAVPRRSTRPMTLETLLRQALSEIADYKRVQILPPVAGVVHGFAATDIIHLVAELLENATKFSPPETQVTVKVQPVAAGLAIDIDDRGLAMPAAQYARIAQLMALPDPAQAAAESPGQIGLYVVARIAHRHGIRIQLQTNVFGGTNAIVLLPPKLFDDQRRPGSGSQATPAVSEPIGLPGAGGPAQIPDPAAEASGVAAIPLPRRGSPAPQATAQASAASDPPPSPASNARPTLPKRQGTYLPEPLRRDAPATATTPTANTSLFAEFRRGYESGDTPQNG